MGLTQELFGKPKAIIGMVHFPPLPGQPLYDSTSGLQGIVDRVAHDLEILVECGFDAVLFCNEGDRPYRTQVGPEAPATMAAVISQVAHYLDIPFGVDILWDPIAAIALAKATGARFVREVFSGVYAADFGLWNTDPAATLSYRRQIDASDVKLFYNITAEFATPLASRDLATTARSTVFSSLADAICVSGPITGVGADSAHLLAAKEALPDTPVFANTGVKPSTVGTILNSVDGCIVGTALKRNGVTWEEVDRERALALLSAAAESGHWSQRRGA
jgi:hypothetical protein